MLNLTDNGDHCILPVKAVPNASRTKLAGTLNGALKVTIAAPPENGAANKALIKFLAKTLSLRENQISLLTGQSSPHKTLRLPPLTAEQQKSLLPNA